MALPQEEKAAEADAAPLRDAVREPEPHALANADALAQPLELSVREARDDEDSTSDADNEALCRALGVEHRDIAAEKEMVRGGELEGDGATECVGVGDAVPQADAAADSDADDEAESAWLCDSDAHVLAVCDAEPVELAEDIKDTDAAPLRDGVKELEEHALAETDTVPHALADDDDDASAVAETVRLCVDAALVLPVRDEEALTHADDAAEGEAAPLSVAVGELEWHELAREDALAQPLPLSVGEARDDTESVGD